MTYAHPSYKFQKPTTINLAFGVPKFIKLTENKSITIKNNEFNVKDEHYYLKAVQYRIIWVKEDNLVRLKKEILQNGR